MTFALTNLAESAGQRWATANANFAALNTGLTAGVSIAITGATVLTAVQRDSGFFFTFTGTLGAATTVDFPATKSGPVVVQNSSGQQLTFRVVGNTTTVVIVPNGGRRLLFLQNTVPVDMGDPSNTAAAPLGIKAEASTARTLVSGDENSIVRMNNAATAATFTFPPSATFNPANGSAGQILRAGTGTLTLVAGTGVNLRASSALTLRAQWSLAGWLKLADNEYLVQGDLDLA